MSELKVPFIDLKRSYEPIRDDIQKNIMKVMDSQKYILGEEVSTFERSMADYYGCKHAIGVGSCSDALYLALLSLGIGQGDEVITTPFTFFATVGAIARAGAKTVLVDINATSFNLDVNQIESKITTKTKAIMAVHLYGNPCAMDELNSICAKHNLKLIEDAAQSFGALYHGKLTGTIGDVGCVSFFPTKNFGGAGDGGMMLTANDDIAREAKRLRVHGSEQKYIHSVLGVNSRLDALQAAVLNVKLKHINGWNNERHEAAKLYLEKLKSLPLGLPTESPDTRHVYHLFTVTCAKRDALQHYLQTNGVGCFVYYPMPMHLQPAISFEGYKEGDYPEAEKACKTVLSLPMYPGIRVEEINRVCEVIAQFFNDNSSANQSKNAAQQGLK